MWVTCYVSVIIIYQCYNTQLLILLSVCTTTLTYTQKNLKVGDVDNKENIWN